MNSLTRIKASDIQMGSNFVVPIENPYKELETKAEHIIKTAEIQKQQLIQAGQKQANEIIAQAQQLVEQAKQECANLIEAAKKEATTESSQIKEMAQKEGYEAGYKQGFEEGTNSLEEKFKALELFAQSQYDIKHNIIKSAELDIVDLVLAIARKVCKKSLDEDIEILKNITVDAIKQLKDKECITITISPELAEKIYSISDKLKEEVPKLNSIRIIEDANVSADGTIVETPLSRVDSRLKTQIDQIAEKMMSEHYSTIEDEVTENNNDLVDISSPQELIENKEFSEYELTPPPLSKTIEHIQQENTTEAVENTPKNEGLNNDNNVQ